MDTHTNPSPHTHTHKKNTNEEVIKSIAPNITIEAPVLKQKLTYVRHVIQIENGIGRDILCVAKHGCRRRGGHHTRLFQKVTNSTGRNLDDLKEVPLIRTVCCIHPLRVDCSLMDT